MIIILKPYEKIVIQSINKEHKMAEQIRITINKEGSIKGITVNKEGGIKVIKNEN